MPEQPGALHLLAGGHSSVKLQKCGYTLSCLLLWLLVKHGGRGREEINPTMNLIGSAIPYVMHVWEQFLPDHGVHLAHVLKSRI